METIVRAVRRCRCGSDLDCAAGDSSDDNGAEVENFCCALEILDPVAGGYIDGAEEIGEGMTPVRERGLFRPVAELCSVHCQALT